MPFETTQCNLRQDSIWLNLKFTINKVFLGIVFNNVSLQINQKNVPYVFSATWLTSIFQPIWDFIPEEDILLITPQGDMVFGKTFCNVRHSILYGLHLYSVCKHPLRHPKRFTMAYHSPIHSLTYTPPGSSALLDTDIYISLIFKCFGEVNKKFDL